MEETLEKSLQRIFGAKPGQDAPQVATRAPEPESPAAGKTSLAAQALEHFRRSQEFLKQGNWSGYGEQLKQVEALLREMQKTP